MTKWFSALVLCLAAAAVPVGAESSVGLGVAVGAAMPDGHTSDISTSNWEPGFNWGFYVDIPLIATFHITPSSELYKLGKENATDMSLAFKFIVPLDRLDAYAGVVAGVTATGNDAAPHVGVVGGAAFPLVSNLDMFAQAKYNVLFDRDENIRVLHLNAGILFRF
jgi:hypothetical protein